jgi:hypothetical protein
VDRLITGAAIDAEACTSSSILIDDVVAITHHLPHESVADYHSPLRGSGQRKERRTRVPSTLETGPVPGREELAELHAADLRSSGHRWLRQPHGPDAEHLFDRVIQSGLLHTDATTWIESLCEQLDRTIASEVAPTVFIHGDVKPDNVMIEPTGRVQLIDWGDAGFADPAYDFQSLPMHAIETALRGYRSMRKDDPTLEARILRRVLARSLSNLCRTPLTGPSWYRPIAANLTDLLTFAIDRRHIWDAWLDQ